MGNEDKIRDITPQSKKKFLPDELPAELAEKDSSAQPYSLEEEFAKSKKNISWRFYLVIVLFLAFFIGSTAALTRYIQYRYHMVDIDIMEFKDTDIKKLLDSAKDTEKEIKNAEKDMVAYGVEIKRKIEGIKKLGENKRNEIKSRNLSKKEISHLIARQKENERNDIAQLKKESVIKINEKKEQIVLLKRKAAVQNTRVKQGIETTRTIVNNYEKLHRLKMKEQKLMFLELLRTTERKYNPVFKSKKLRFIINEPEETENDSPLSAYKKELAKEKTVTRENFEKQRENIGNLYLLFKRLLKIPYKNSVRRALKRMDKMNRSIMRDYELIWTNLVASVKKKNIALSGYRHAFDYYARMHPESGYIIDPRDPKHIRIFLNKVMRKKVSGTAMIFRADDEYIAEIEFIPGTDGTLAKVLRMQGRKKIKPFDKVLVNIGNKK